MITKRINVLEPAIANKIAAGEVVERPASVVKELVENSLDAGATSITIEIRNGGLEYIRVTDNGCGIRGEDVELAFLRHATSKLVNADGLECIETLGFRGEALASISAVSLVTLRTNTTDDEFGTLLKLEGGTAVSCMPCGCPVGTSIEVSNLFYNVPARLKFMKSAGTEAAAVGDYVLRLILANTDVSIKFINNGKSIYQSAGDGSLESALVCVYGSNTASHIFPVAYDDGYVLINGFCGDEHLSRNTRTQQSLFVNDRYIKSSSISSAAQRAYDTRLMSGRFPFFVLHIRISPREIDVNVHPNKLAVRFKDESRITNAVNIALREALSPRERTVTQNVTVAEPASDTYGRSGSESSGSKGSVDETPYNFFKEVGRTKTIPAENGGEESLHKDPPKEYTHRSLDFYDKDTGDVLCFRDSEYSLPSDKDYKMVQIPHYSFEKEPVIAKKEEKEQVSFGITTYRIIGSAFDTYLIVQQDDSIFLIDQHAAHERMLYEKLTRNELRFHSQLLLTSASVTLTPIEHDVIVSNIERFRELGFDIEEFGALSVSIHSVPMGISADRAERLLRDMIAILKEQGKVNELDIVRSSLIQSACKHAIKAGDVLDKQQIETLLTAIADGSTPLTCPHGRPIIIRVAKKEVEKLFKRIV